MAIELTSQNFEQEALQSSLPVIIDFWADWCGPCRMLSPILAQLEQELAGQAKVCKVNVDEQPALAMQYGVGSIPTVLCLRGGAESARSVGLRDKESLRAALGL